MRAPAGRCLNRGINGNNREIDAHSRSERGERSTDRQAESLTYFRGLSMIPTPLSCFQRVTAGGRWPHSGPGIYTCVRMLATLQKGRGSIAGNTVGELARCGSETKRNPRLRFGLVWSPGRVCDVSPELPPD